MRCHLKSVLQLASHWTSAAFKDNIVPISDLIVLVRLVNGSVGAIECRNLLVRSMSAAYKLAVNKDGFLLMRGVEMLQDT